MRVCVLVLRFFDDYAKDPNIADKPDTVLNTKRSQASIPMSLDAMKLYDKDAIKEEIMRQLQGEIASVKMDALKRGFVSKVDAPVQPMVTRIFRDKPGDMNDQLNLSRPGTNSIRELTIFSSEDSLDGNNLPGQKYNNQKGNWQIPFQVNKPPLADVNFAAEARQKNRDPRRDIKYFSFEDSSSSSSQFQPTTVNFKKEPQQLGGLGGSAVLRQSGNRVLETPQGNLPGEAREDIIRGLMQAQEEKYRARVGDLKRIETAYRGLLGNN